MELVCTVMGEALPVRRCQAALGVEGYTCGQRWLLSKLGRKSEFEPGMCPQQEIADLVLRLTDEREVRRKRWGGDPSRIRKGVVQAAPSIPHLPRIPTWGPYDYMSRVHGPKESHDPVSTDPPAQPRTSGLSVHDLWPEDTQ